jgi:hypothetical protein
VDLVIKLDDVWTDGERLSEAVMTALVDGVVDKLRRDDFVPTAKKQVGELVQVSCQGAILDSLKEVLDGEFDVPMGTWGDSTRRTTIREELKLELSKAMKELKSTDSRTVYGDLVKSVIREMLGDEIKGIAAELRTTVRQQFESGVRAALPKV